MGLDCSGQENAIFTKTGESSESIFPHQVFIEVTHHCNLRCVHCYLEHSYNKREEISTAKFMDIIDQLREVNVFFLGFTGGEILSHPDFFEIAEHAKKRGLFYHFQTNGSLITAEVADRIKKLNPSKVEVSIYGSKPEVHDSVVGVLGSFIRSVNALQLLKKRGIRTVIKTTIMKENLPDLERIESLAKNLGATFIPDPLIAPGVEGSQYPLDYRLSDGEMKEFMIKRGWTEDSSDDPLAISLERKLICSAGRTRCTIAPDGSVYPCVLWRTKAGSLRRQRFKDIWEGDVFKDVRSVTISNLQNCSVCVQSHLCVRCPGFAYLEQKNYLAPASESCRMAKNLMEVRKVG